MPNPFDRPGPPSLPSQRSAFDLSPEPVAETPAAPEGGGGGGFLRNLATALPMLLGGPGAFAATLTSLQARDQARSGGSPLGQMMAQAMQSEDPIRTFWGMVQERPDLADLDGIADAMEIFKASRRDVRNVGSQLVDVTGGQPQVIHEAPDAAPTSIREAEAMGWDLRTGEGRAAYSAWKRAQSPGTTVNNYMPQPMKENVWSGVGMDRVKAADETLAQAATIMPELRGMKSAIEQGAVQGMGVFPNIAVRTPWGQMGFDTEQAALWAHQLGASLGIVDREQMAATELFHQIQSKLTPLLRPAGSGSSSDADMQLFMDALPNLSRTREGNLAIIDFYERAYERNLQEMEILEKQLTDGTYTPSAYRRATAALGELWTRADEARLETLAAAEQAEAEAPRVGQGEAAEKTRVAHPRGRNR